MPRVLMPLLLMILLLTTGCASKPLAKLQPLHEGVSVQVAPRRLKLPEFGSEKPYLGKCTIQDPIGLPEPCPMLLIRVLSAPGRLADQIRTQVDGDFEATWDWGNAQFLETPSPLLGIQRIHELDGVLWVELARVSR
jgi:hypothetical protein